MKNSHLIGACAAILILVAAIGFRYWGAGKSIVKQSEQVEQAQQNATHNHYQSQNQPQNQAHPNAGMAKHDDHSHDHDHSRLVNESAADKTKQDTNSQNDHLSRLTPEMKQAVKDKLLLHGPMEVIQNPDGSFSLPSNGRFTQMPVAVQNPDGTIEIREYSVIPE